MVCVILRLARFNVENTPDPASHRRFKGLPSPAGAGCILSLAILRSLPPNNLANIPPDVLREVVKYWAPIGGLIVALLMVSRVSYPHLTKQVLRGRRHHTYLLRIIFVVFVLALVQQLALVIVFWGYALMFAVRHLIRRARRRQTVVEGGGLLVDGDERLEEMSERRGLSAPPDRRDKPGGSPTRVPSEPTEEKRAGGSP
jgi:phosphatidylserine synthase